MGGPSVAGDCDGKGRGGWLKEEFSKLVNLAATMESQIHVIFVKGSKFAVGAPTGLALF